MPSVKYWLAIAFSTGCPRPWTPIIEETTTMASAIMMHWLTPAMMVGSASGSCTFLSLCQLDEPKASAKKFKSAVTDTETVIRFDPVAKPGISNLLTIYATLTGTRIPELEERYEGKGYGALKTDLAEVYVEWVTPFRERALAYLDDPESLDALLAKGAEKARAVAAETLATVYDRVGFVPAKH